MATETITLEEILRSSPNLLLAKTACEPVRSITPTSPSNTRSSALSASDSLEAADSTEAEPVYPTGANFWLPILSIALMLIVGGLDNNIVATAVPALTDHFHTVADIGWYSAAFRLTLCTFQFLFGKLYKIFSVKRVFMVVVCVFILGSVICATAVTSKMFVLGRAVTGLAEAGVVAGCFTVLVQLLPLRRRPLYGSVLAAIEASAELSAPILGGVLTQTLGWRWCFWINLPLSGIVLLITAVFFHDPQTSPGAQLTLRAKLSQLDLLGNLVFIPGLTSLFLALSWAGSKYPWKSPTIIALFLLSALLLAVFAYLQHRKGDAATLPPRIIKQRSVLAGLLFSGCVNSHLNVLLYYMPTYFQAVRGFTPAKSGYMVLPMVLGQLVGFLGLGIGTSTFGYYVPFMLAGSVLMPVASGLMTTWNISTSYAQLILYQALAGFGGGIGFQGPQSAVQTILPTSDAPLGLAIVLFAQHFGPAVTVVIAQTVFTNQLTANLEDLGGGLDAAKIEHLGLSDLKDLFGGGKLAEVLGAFDTSVIRTWDLVVALGCVSMAGSLAMEWKSVKVKRS